MITNQEKIELLQLILGKAKKTTGSNYIFVCPFCKHKKPKLQIHLDLGEWRCWVCPEKGKSFRSLLKKIQAPKELIDKFGFSSILPNFGTNIAPILTKVSLPNEYLPLSKKRNSPDFRHALTYVLNKRKVPLYDVVRYSLGYCEQGSYSGMIIIPSYDENYNLNFFSARSFYNTEIKHRTPPISKDVIAFESMINWNLPITIVEGPFDAITVKHNCIPLYGKYPSKRLVKRILNSEVKEIYLALDNDAISRCMSMAEELMANGKTVYIVNIPDSQDPSTVGFIKMQELINLASQLTYRDLIKFKLNLI